MVLAAICRRCYRAESGSAEKAGCPPLFLRQAGSRAEHAVAFVVFLLVGQSWGKEIGYGKQQAGAEHSGFFPQYRP